jgi:hypothetical protein
MGWMMNTVRSAKSWAWSSTRNLSVPSVHDLAGANGLYSTWRTRNNTATVSGSRRTCARVSPAPPPTNCSRPPQDAKAIQNKRRFTELGTTKSGTFFRTDALRALATDFKDNTDAYARKQSGLVREVVNIASKRGWCWCRCVSLMGGAATYTPVLESMDNVIAHLDVILR